jgi:hypothetical protein
MGITSRIWFHGLSFVYLRKYSGKYFLILHADLHNKVRQEVPNRAHKASFPVGWIFSFTGLLLLSLFNFIFINNLLHIDRFCRN